MISFSSENNFLLEQEKSINQWINFAIDQEKKVLGEVNYIFCNDNYLLEKNVKILKHNSLTDIISLDYSLGNTIFGDIFISTERVKENSSLYETKFKDELHRVMIHGILHYCGYKDKTVKEKKIMRAKEDYYLSLRTF